MATTYACTRTTARAQARAGTRYPFLTSKERDTETGLDYFLARYYSSIQGRFTSPDEFKGGPEELFGKIDPHDPLFYSETAEPQSLNKYQYCLNNPLRYIDPDGHQTATADALKVGVTLTVAAPHPVAKVVGVGILIGVGVEVTIGWKNVGRGVKAVLDQGGQSASQQDLADLRLLRQQETKPPNPDGQKGASDHQEEVKKQADQARAEAKPGETVVEGKRIRGVDSTRRPDVQVVGPDGKVVKVVEVERRPNSRRNREREAEYEQLKVPNRTVPIQK